MNEITNMFTDIGNSLANSDWYFLVKWPFWALLSLVAVGGVYCARFGKKTLVNTAVCCTLTITITYLIIAMLSIGSPMVRNLFPGLPFLALSDESVFLVSLLEPNLALLSPRLLNLMILVLMFSLMDSIVSSKGFGVWIFTQVVAAILALAAYAVVMAGLGWIVPELLNRYAIIPVVLVLAIGLLMFCAKFIFSLVISGGNPQFDTIYKFFTVNKGGSLLTVSSFAFLFCLILILVLRSVGLSELIYAEANMRALGIVLTLLIVTLALFSMLFTDRKKA